MSIAQGALRVGLPECNTLGHSVTYFTKKECLIVPNVEKNTKGQLITEQEIFIAQTLATKKREEIAELITNKDNVQCVKKSLLSISTQQQYAVQEVVAVNLVQKIEPTYCVTVPNNGCFALDNGLIVSNCGYIIVRLYPIVVPSFTAKLSNF